jgi:hypothetical protein
MIDNKRIYEHVKEVGKASFADVEDSVGLVLKVDLDAGEVQGCSGALQLAAACCYPKHGSRLPVGSGALVGRYGAATPRRNEA